MWVVCFKQKLQSKLLLLHLFSLVSESLGSNKPKLGPATNKVYIKLDVIGEEYLKKYKDKSSQEFKKMASEIEQEVIVIMIFLCKRPEVDQCIRNVIWIAKSSIRVRIFS